MIYKLIVTRKAKRQLDNLLYYLKYEIQNGQAAQHLLKEIQKIYERLKNNPEQFPYCLDENLKEKKYRKAVLLTMNYTVIFQIDQNNVHIIGIFHNLENYGEQL